MTWKEIEKEANRQSAIAALKVLFISMIVVAGLIFSLITIGTYLEHKSEKELSEKIHSYNTITLNGEVFETKQMINVDIQSHPYANNTVIFSMSDGTEVEVQEGNWTLKN